MDIIDVHPIIYIAVMVSYILKYTNLQQSSKYMYTFTEVTKANTVTEVTKANAVTEITKASTVT